MTDVIRFQIWANIFFIYIKFINFFEAPILILEYILFSLKKTFLKKSISLFNVRVVVIKVETLNVVSSIISTLELNLFIASNFLKSKNMKSSMCRHPENTVDAEQCEVQFIRFCYHYTLNRVLSLPRSF